MIGVDYIRLILAKCTYEVLAGEKPMMSDDGWLTAIDKIYRCNLVRLISAKNCSDAK
jgi:hypothetical protein